MLKKIAHLKKFVYLAFAELSDEGMWVKVGISSRPIKRIEALNAFRPIRSSYCTDQPVRYAYRIEHTILFNFRHYRTNGEWLLIPRDRYWEIDRIFDTAVDALAYFEQATELRLVYPWDDVKAA